MTKIIIAVVWKVWIALATGKSTITIMILVMIQLIEDGLSVPSAKRNLLHGVGIIRIFPIVANVDLDFGGKKNETNKNSLWRR